MSWVKVDDGLYMHPKVLAAGVPAMGLWVRCLAYAAAHMTDGFVPSDAAYGVVSRRSSLPDELVRAGLWRRDDALNGWWIHDYLTYNRSRAQLVSERDAKKKAGELSAERRWKTVTPAIGPAPAPAIADSILPSRPVPSRPSLEKDGEQTKAPLTPPGGFEGAEMALPGIPPAAPKARAKSAKAALPDDWVPSARCLELLAGEGVTADAALACLPDFRDYWRSEAGRKADWDATFRQRVRWLRDRDAMPKAASESDGLTTADMLAMSKAFGGRTSFSGDEMATYFAQKRAK